MKFEIGEEYKTRSGRKAVVLFDISPVVCNATFPLKGYIERACGKRYDETWTSEGKYKTCDALREDDNDIIAPWNPPKDYNVFMYFSVETDGIRDLKSFLSLPECKESRNRDKNSGNQVSGILDRIFIVE